MSLVRSSYISYRVGASLHVHVSTTCFIHHAAYFILRVHVPRITCLLLRTYSYIHLMSTTQLDRSRSPTMPCILLVYIYRKIAASCMTSSRSPIRKIAASCTTRLASGMHVAQQICSPTHMYSSNIQDSGKLVWTGGLDICIMTFQCCYRVKPYSFLGGNFEDISSVNMRTYVACSSEGSCLATSRASP